MWWNGRFTSWMCSRQICSNCVMLSCQYGPKSLRNVFNTLLNLCLEELRQFWKQKGVQPNKVPVSVYSIYIHLTDMVTRYIWYSSCLLLWQSVEHISVKIMTTHCGGPIRVEIGPHGHFGSAITLLMEERERKRNCSGLKQIHQDANVSLLLLQTQIPDFQRAQQSI